MLMIGLIVCKCKYFYLYCTRRLYTQWRSWYGSWVMWEEIWFRQEVVHNVVSSNCPPILVTLAATPIVRLFVTQHLDCFPGHFSRSIDHDFGKQYRFPCRPEFQQLPRPRHVQEDAENCPMGPVSNDARQMSLSPSSRVFSNTVSFGQVVFPFMTFPTCADCKL